ncbi:MFS transporter (plasmid) [Ralstonia solanacearum]|nr:MFS transporter [Ralstonia solanacearum]
MLLAAILSGLNNRVPGLALADVQGALGFAQDDASWLNTAYAAGELAAMPFATWFAVTFSMRRFHLAMLAGALVLSAILPFVQSLSLLLALRALQGLLSGALIPMLMMSALRFLPPPIRLHGLALYAMTATFAPNVALWLAALCVDRLEDWRWVYWQAIPLGLVAMGLVAWGVPKMPPALSRLKQGNWLGMALGVPGLALVVAGLDQGVRLDWFHSPLIVATLGVGIVLTALFLATSVVQPMEGPSVAGIVNTFRAFSSVLGGALIGQLTTVRSHFHADMLLDHAGHLLPRLPPSDPGALTLAAMVSQQAGVLAAADVYRVFGWLALLLIPIVLKLQYIPAPAQTRTPQATPPAGTQTGTAH